MRGTGDEVARLAAQVLEPAHGVDDSLDTLAGTHQAPRQERRPARALQRGHRRQRRAALNRDDLSGVDGVVGAEALVGRA